MNIFQKWLGILLLAIASSSLIVACGDAEDSKCGEGSNCADEDALECTTDDDCDTEAGEICDDTNACVLDTTPECTTDEDCDTEAGEICDDTNACVLDPTPECTTDDDCDTDAGEICDDTNTCVLDPTPECTTDSQCDVNGGERCDTDTNTCVIPSTCIVDQDCANGMLCNFATELCAFDCTDEPTICLGSETCVARADSDGGSICAVVESTDECSVDTDCDTDAGEICDLDTNTCVVDETPECTTADDCDIEAGEVCLQGQCVIDESEPHLFVKIADVSEACDSTVSDPGSDLFGVQLEKGPSVYYAETVGSNILDEDTNLYPSPDLIIDGVAPELAGVCPESFEGNVVSLGCGGDVVVAFVDDTGAQIEIEDGDAIRPLEWGGQCTTGPSVDAWEVLLCDPTVAEGDLIFDTSACAGTSMGTGQIDNAVTVTLP